MVSKSFQMNRRWSVRAKIDVHFDVLPSPRFVAAESN